MGRIIHFAKGDKISTDIGDLTVIDEYSISPKRWLVLKCHCGKKFEVLKGSVLAGKTRSCGCYHDRVAKERINKHNTKHGMTRTPEYSAWQAMLSRCNYKNNISYKYYGGRGIKVCDEWAKDFLAFYEHVGPRPTDRHSIDKIDNNGDYEPGNVRWATPKVQNNNKRTNRIIEVNGVKKSLSLWAEHMGLSSETLSRRIDKHGIKAIQY